MAIFLIYFVLFSSWLGHYRSITHWPYSIGFLGNARFIISLFIIYVYYYAFALFKTENVKYSEGLFYYIFPVIFGAYFFYDIIKNLEYKDRSQKEKKDLIYRGAITLVFLIFFILASIGYYYLAGVEVFGLLELGEVIIWKPVFIVLFFIMIILYRFKKRHIKSKQRFKV
jgi:hypothetical protein